jgi:hypothetical protein
LHEFSNVTISGDAIRFDDSHLDWWYMWFRSPSLERIVVHIPGRPDEVIDLLAPDPAPELEIGEEVEIPLPRGLERAIEMQIAL